MIRHPIFVVGMPRSGTTLLSTMLDAHPRITISPETHFFSLAPFDPASTDPADVEAAFAFLGQQPGVQDMALTDEERAAIRARVEAADTPCPATVLRALLSTYADRFDGSAWGEKTPNHLRAVPTIARLYPDAVFVSIVRDPRDVCLSLRGLPWSRDSLPEAAWTWRRFAERSEAYREAAPDRFWEGRYEDLLEGPEAVLRDLCAFLDAPYDPAMLRFHEQATPAVRAEPWKAKASQPVDPSNRDKWRTQMGPAERWVVQTVAGRSLQQKGYSAPPVPFDGVFWRDLVRVLGRTLRTVVGRIRRRWQTPSRTEDDYRPVWVRQGDGPDP